MKAAPWAPRAPPARPPARQLSYRVSASSETEAHFRRRLQRSGFAQPKPDEDLHPVAREAWRAVHQIYGAPCFETPLLPAPFLAEHAEGSTVHLKCENKQATGSFKARGAVHKLLSLTVEELQRGVVAASTGNHALAVLHAAKAAAAQRGVQVPVRLFLPRTASAAKADKLRQLGAQVEFHGTDCVEAEAEARRAAGQQGAVYVSPYNDVAVAGGQGSIAIELLMQLPRGQLDTVFVPVGGGGLISGIASVLKAADPNIRIIGCQPAVSDVMRQSVAAGRVVEVGWQETLSEGTVGGIEMGAVTLEPCAKFVDDWVVVSEEEIARAVIDTVTHTGFQVEGATGVAVAAFMKVAKQLHDRHCVIVVCGGNMSTEGMQQVFKVAGVAGGGRRAVAA